MRFLLEPKNRMTLDEKSNNDSEPGRCKLRLVFAISRTEDGEAMPFVVQRWECEKGMAPIPGPEVLCRSLDDARREIPDGFVSLPPSKMKGESKTLVETWEPSSR